MAPLPRAFGVVLLVLACHIAVNRHGGFFSALHTVQKAIAALSGSSSVKGRS